MLTACAWCPETAETAQAIRDGVPVSHGICPVHEKELLNVIHGHEPETKDIPRALQEYCGGVRQWGP